MLNVVYINCEGTYIESEWDSVDKFISTMESDNTDIPMLDDYICTVDCDEYEELNNKNYEDFYTVGDLFEYAKVLITQ